MLCYDVINLSDLGCTVDRFRRAPTPRGKTALTIFIVGFLTFRIRALRLRADIGSGAARRGGGAPYTVHGRGSYFDAANYYWQRQKLLSSVLKYNTVNATGSRVVFSEITTARVHAPGTVSHSQY